MKEGYQPQWEQRVTQQDPPGDGSRRHKTESAGLFDPAVSAQPERADEVIDVEYEVLRQAVRPARGSEQIRQRPRRSSTASGVTAHALLTGEDARDALAGWSHAPGQSPAPRHRRRLILKWVKPLNFADCLVAGFGDGQLLGDIVRQRRSLGRKIAGFGCDASLDDANEAAPDPLGSSLPRFNPLGQIWPNGRQFDLVVCPELLGQAPQWRPALANLIAMTRRYLLLTVPAGPIRMADRVAGHLHHFDSLELAGAVVGHGLTLLKQRNWGFPVHSLYQSTLGHLPAGLSSGRPPGERSSSLPMRLAAEGLYLAFFSNDLFHGGAQQILLAERRSSDGSDGSRGKSA
jgi:hypothetical protein